MDDRPAAAGAAGYSGEFSSGKERKENVQKHQWMGQQFSD